MTYSVLQLSSRGYIWEIDASVIADDRALYYMNLGLSRGLSEAEAQGDYQETYDYTISDSYELQDWYFNNMNWSDIPDQNKKLVQTPPPLSSPDELDDDAEIESKVL